MPYRKRPDMPCPSAVPMILANLKQARSDVIDMMRDVRPFGPAYVAGERIMKEIDALAEMLTGDARYFAIKPAPAGSTGVGSGKRSREAAPCTTSREKQVQGRSNATLEGS